MFAPFYHELLRKYHIAFGSLFKNITLLRYDAAGTEKQRLVIPIEYSARESWLTRLRADPSLSGQKEIVVPRFGYEMTSLRYDASRKLNSLNQRTIPTASGALRTARRYFVGTPYVLTFNLYALTRSIEDANEITEQILPMFTPDYSLLLRLIPSLGILDRMRIVMDGSPQSTDNYESEGFENTREIILTFTFNVSATFYGPVAHVPPSIIRHIMIDLYNIPNESVMEGPTYLLTDALDRLQLNGISGRLLDESSIIDLRDFARIARIDIVPDPIDALPQKPVGTTTTITNYTDGKQVDYFTGTDVDIDT